VKHFLAFGLACSGLFLLQADALAISTTYTFDVSTIVEIRNGVVATPQERLFLSTDTISVTLTYDDSVVGAFDPFGMVYSNLSNTAVNIGSLNYNDSSGTTLVSNDAWPPVGSSDLVDAVLLQSCRCALPVVGSPQLADGVGEAFTLLDTRIFWGENFSGTDFLNDQSLLSALPPVGGGSGAAALAFVTIESGVVVDQHVVRGQISSVSAVPIPAAVYLFASGLALLGWFRRRQSA
jgi:hypothetical protein